MYNRYIPSQTHYETVDSGDGKDRGQTGCSQGTDGMRQGFFGGISGDILGKLRDNAGDSLGQTVSALFKAFHLENLDAGDILLALIVLFLILEDGDNLDLIITLGLMILFSLGEQ